MSMAGSDGAGDEEKQLKEAKGASDDESDGAKLSTYLLSSLVNRFVAQLVSQHGLVKDGVLQCTVSSSQMSRSDMRANANIISSHVLRRSAKAPRAFMAFGASRTPRTTLRLPTSEAMLSSALVWRPLMPPTTALSPRVGTLLFLLLLHDRDSDLSKFLIVHT